MKCHLLLILLTAIVPVVTLASTSLPEKLLHSIPAPPVGFQSGAQLGFSIAVDEAYTVVGAPYDDIGGQEAGVVKVFDTTTGALRFLLQNPEPMGGDYFGFSVAISGTRVVVGAIGNDTGVDNAGTAYVFELNSGTPTVPVATLTNPTPSVGDYVGSSVAISGSLVVVGASLDDTSGTDSGCAYVYNLDGGIPTVPLVTLNNPDPAADDYFGNSVAISGTRVVVGAIGDDSGANGAGSVYVFDLSAAPTEPVTKLNNPAPATGDQFGRSVSISGAYVVVGVPTDDMGGTDSGNAYVYNLGSGTPTVPTDTLNNPSPASGDYFGYSVAISGTRVLVGAYRDDTSAIDAGSAYEYDLGSGTPTLPVSVLNNPVPAVDDRFGHSVAISGTWVVAGAPNDDTGATNAGSAYVYDRSNGTATIPFTILNKPSPMAGDYFGWSVAIDGARVVIGAHREDTGAPEGGAVYVYDLNSGTPTIPVFILNNPSPEHGDYFGYSVAISGTRVVVGAIFEDTGASSAGSAYVYNLSNGNPTVPVATLNNPEPGLSDQFGNAVAISGTRVVVGAYADDNVAIRSAGCVYVYDLSSGTTTVPVVKLSNPSPEVDDFFGISLAISGTRVVVGTKLDDTGATNAGSAYVYDLNSGTPAVPVVTLNNPSPAADDYFGSSVAISGTRVVVGGILDDTGAIDAGSAYVYDVAGVSPTSPMVTLHNPSPADSDQFGNSVAISGTRVVVGAYADENVSINGGSSYVYDLRNDTPSLPLATLDNPSPSASDFFGWVLAIDGINVVVGTPFEDSVALDKGHAYVYTLSTKPELTTATATNVTETTATLGGEVTSDGGRIVTARGVVYATTSAPSLADSKEMSESGGAGGFSVSATGLTPGTTFYARAYATNAIGTSYGPEINFTTGAIATFSNGVSTFNRSILSGGHHVFYFNLAGPRVVSFSTVGGAYLHAELYHNTGNLIASFIGDGDFDLEELLLGGDYELHVFRADDGGSAQTFDLTIDASLVASTRPDVAVGASSGGLAGVGVYSPTSQVAGLASFRAGVVTGFVTISNRGKLPDAIAVKGTGSNALFGVSYSGPEGNITAGLITGTYRTAEMDENVASVSLRVTISPNKKRLTKKNGKKNHILKKSHAVLIQAKSTLDPLIGDSALISVQTK